MSEPNDAPLPDFYERKIERLREEMDERLAAERSKAAKLAAALTEIAAIEHSYRAARIARGAFVALMLVSIAAMVFSAWAEQALQRRFDPLLSAARAARTAGNWKEKNKNLRRLVGWQLLAYAPAVFVIASHVILFIRLARGMTP